MSKPIESSAPNPYCRFVHVANHHNVYIQREDVRELSASQKDAVFGHAFSRIGEKAQKSALTLSRIQRLAPGLSSCLALKAAQVDDFVFRLINAPNGSLTSLQPAYIAVSYRWGAGKRTIARTDSQLFYLRKRDPINLMPIPPVLYAAILSELDPVFEGVWCDQACINQADPHEKAVSVGMMNLVYEQARFVAIVLADISLTVEEKDFLEQYASSYAEYQESGNLTVYFHGYESPPYLSVQPVLRGIYLKIMNAEWFNRCWCSHEMRMSRYQVFFVPCDEVNVVCRFTGPFLFDLILLAIEVPNPWTAILLRPYSAAHHTVLNGVFERPYPNMILEPFEHINSLLAGGDPDPDLTDAERQLTGARDKLSITLNTMQLDFTVDSKAFLAFALHEDPVPYSTRLLSILSLALDDPLVLCTSGQSLPTNTSSQTRSWIRQMNRFDVPANQQSTEELLHLNSSEDITISALIDSYISLPLVTFDSDSRIIAPSPTWVTLASLTLEILLAHSPNATETSDAYYPWRGTARGADVSTRTLFQHTLACLLSAGPAWLNSALSVSRGAFIIAEGLQAALSPLVSSGFPGLASNPADSKVFINWIRTPDGASTTALVAQFTIFILQRALPGPWTPEMVAAYTPIMFISESWTRHLLVVPVTERDTRAVVPDCLLDDRYYDMCRVWLIREVNIKGEKCWTLRARTRAFGPSLGRKMNALKGFDRDSRSVRVYGPLKEDQWQV